MKKQNANNRLGIALIISFIVVVGLFFSQSPAIATFVKPTPTLEDPVLRAMAGEMAYYDEQLQKENLEPEDQKKLEAERKYAARQATERADYLQTPEDVQWAVKQTVIAEITMEPTPTFGREKKKVGLRDIDVDFPWVGEADFSTLWTEPVGDGYVKFFAGQLKKDPEQGILVIYDESARTVQRFYSPAKGGGLRIVDVKNGKIELKTKKEKKLFFDYKEKKFADENGMILEAAATPNTPANASAAYPYPPPAYP